ncbi:unnamed protein product, partial [Arabidopsis halleri]
DASTLPYVRPNLDSLSPVTAKLSLFSVFASGDEKSGEMTDLVTMPSEMKSSGFAISISKRRSSLPPPS